MAFRSCGLIAVTRQLLRSFFSSGDDTFCPEEFYDGEFFIR